MLSSCTLCFAHWKEKPTQCLHTYARFESTAKVDTWKARPSAAMCQPFPTKCNPHNQWQKSPKRPNSPQCWNSKICCRTLSRSWTLPPRKWDANWARPNLLPCVAHLSPGDPSHNVATAAGAEWTLQRISDPSNQTVVLSQWWTWQT